MIIFSELINDCNVFNIDTFWWGKIGHFLVMSKLETVIQLMTDFLLWLSFNRFHSPSIYLAQPPPFVVTWSIHLNSKESRSQLPATFELGTYQGHRGTQHHTSLTLWRYSLWRDTLQIWFVVWRVSDHIKKLGSQIKITFNVFITCFCTSFAYIQCHWIVFSGTLFSIRINAHQQTDNQQCILAIAACQT